MPQLQSETIDPRSLGHRLQVARKARGLTQQQAADEISAARTTITALEKGERRVRPEELIILANLYEKQVGDFVSPKRQVVDFSTQFRTADPYSKRAAKPNELARVIDEFQSLCENYLHLEQIHNLETEANYPAQYKTEKIAPEASARDISYSERTRLGIGDGPVHGLREVLEHDVGIRVFSFEMPPRVAGIFGYTDELGGCIAVNASHPAERRRWSLAHEYGHFLSTRLNSEITFLGVHRRVPASERFADAFAACFLMPEQGLRRRINELVRLGGGSITAAEICRIAHYYFVSFQAMTLRLEELGILNRGTWDRLRERGFRVREALDQLKLPEHPSDNRLLPIRYEFLAIRAYEQGDLSEGQLANLLRTDRITARQVVQRLSSSVHLLDKGEFETLRIPLAGELTARQT